MELVILPGGREEILGAAFARNGRGARIGRNQEGLATDDVLIDGHHDIGKDDANDDVDAVCLDVAVDVLLADVWMMLIIRTQELAFQTTAIPNTLHYAVEPP